MGGCGGCGGGGEGCGVAEGLITFVLNEEWRCHDMYSIDMCMEVFRFMCH